MTEHVRKVVFPVAGRGTRTLPASKAVPKELLPVVDRPLIQHVFEEAAASGIEQFIFVTGPEKGAIEDHFRRHKDLEAALEKAGKTDALAAIRDFVPDPRRLRFVLQDAPLGLGHAVWCARDAVGDDPFAVMLPDDLIQGPSPCLGQLTTHHAKYGGIVVAVMEVAADQTGAYGIVDPAGDADSDVIAVRGLVEKPPPDQAPSRLAVVGRYILAPEIFGELDRQERGAGGEIQLTDAMARLIDKVPVHAVRFEGRRFDCGNPFGLIEANVAFGLADPSMEARLRASLRAYMT